jgi:diphthamide biosynthesis methyltransferase
MFNKIKQNIKINTHNSIYIDIYNKQIQNISIVQVLVTKGYVLKINLNVLKINYQDNFLSLDYGEIVTVSGN